MPTRKPPRAGRSISDRPSAATGRPSAHTKTERREARRQSHGATTGTTQNRASTQPQIRYIFAFASRRGAERSIDRAHLQPAENKQPPMGKGGTSRCISISRTRSYLSPQIALRTWIGFAIHESPVTNHVPLLTNRARSTRYSHSSRNARKSLKIKDGDPSYPERPGASVSALPRLSSVFALRLSIRFYHHKSPLRNHDRRIFPPFVSQEIPNATVASDSSQKAG